jgi:MFS family permease
MRVFHGMVNAATTPFSYSLITEYFPPDKRATANALIHSGIYIGNSVSSISILLLK